MELCVGVRKQQRQFRGCRGRGYHRILENMETTVAETAIPLLYVAFVTSPSKFLLLSTASNPRGTLTPKDQLAFTSLCERKQTMEKVFKQPKRYGSLPFTLILGHFSNTTLSLQPYHFDYAQYRPRFLLKKIATSTYLHTNWCLETLPPFRYL